MNKQIPYLTKNRIPGMLVFYSVLCLLLGGLIYILLRPSEPMFFDWIKKAGFANFLQIIRENSVSFRLILPEWFIYSLPNGLWAFAYSILITGIWWRSESRLKYYWMTTIPLLVFGFEILQNVGLIQGTFSFQDILLGSIGIGGGILIGIKPTKLYRYEKSKV